LENDSGDVADQLKMPENKQQETLKSRSSARRKG